VTNPDYKQEATVPLADETHGGEDVAVFADGAGAYLVRGSMEENWIFFVMKEAMRLK
jgi:alkaline phosphatase